jgi:alpha-1,3-rhamnosyl/mannosyltransferase
MRILINRYAALGPKTGVGHYTTELLRCFRRLARGHIDVTPGAWLFHAEQLWGRLRPYLNPGHSAASKRSDAPPGPPQNGWKRAWKDMLHVGRDMLTQLASSASVQSRCDLYHEPNYIPLPIHLPTVVTVCDLSSLLHPEWHPRDRVAEFEQHFHRGLERCQHIITISEYVRQEIIHTLNVPPERVTRTHLGIRQGMAPLPSAQVMKTLKRLKVPANYLLYVGTLEPRKNLLTLLRAYCGLPAELRERYPLVLVGGWGWKADAIADFLDREGRARGVHHLGYVADKHLAALYNGARALVYPSLYEGFGLPPLEMMACGGAVLASTAGALVETVGRQAHMIDPADVDGWRDGMRRVMEDNEWWGMLRHRAVEVARPYTWNHCALQTWRVYVNVLRGVFNASEGPGRVLARTVGSDRN